MKHTSILIESPCELINLTPLNPFISRCQIKVCYVGDKPNRNGSVITKDVAREMANTLPGCPIVGFYNEKTEDFEEHNRRIEISGGVIKFEDTTRPYGFIDLNAKAWFQDYLDDGVVHTYLVTEGYLWTGQYPETKRILESGNNQSMELDENSLTGSWTIDDKSGMEFFIINEAVISKLCILGEDYEPCFEGSRITKFSLDDDFNQKIYNLMKQVRELKGGSEEMNPEEQVVKNEEETNIVDTDFSINDQQQEEENAVITEEENVVEQEVVEPTFSLEDYNSLKENFDNLQNQYNELSTSYSALENSYNELVTFKKTKELEEKQAMIDSFYMLSEEDKKDVQDNIENYSLEEIEGKLAIICVHNKLNLSDEQKEEQVVETSFSFNDNEPEEQVPALISLLRKTRNNQN